MGFRMRRSPSFAALTITRARVRPSRAGRRKEGAHLAPGSKPSREVAVRLALVHEFRTRSKVLVSTEAGAKGLNLQFCETVINYDLPWNPQRIEQRIGRCHRYSQTRDVTVVAFINRENEGQQLTFEILSQKLDLFGKARPGCVGHRSARAAHQCARDHRLGLGRRAAERSPGYLQPFAHGRRGHARDRRAARQDRGEAGGLRAGIPPDLADHRVPLRRRGAQSLPEPSPGAPRGSRPVRPGRRRSGGRLPGGFRHRAPAVW